MVERSQGVGKAWAEPHTAADAADLQRRLDRFDRLQREQYPHGDEGQPRAAVYPGLAHSGRAYDPTTEADEWRLERVLDHLAGYVVRRKVDPQGKYRVYNNQRFVGREWAGRYVWVSLDPIERRWVIADESGREFRRVDATELTTEAVCGLRMVYRTTTRPSPQTEPVLLDRPDAEGPSAGVQTPAESG